VPEGARHSLIPKVWKGRTSVAEKFQRSFLKRAAVATVVGGVALSMTLADGAVAQDDDTEYTLVVGKVGLHNIPHMNPWDSGWVIQGELNNMMYDPMIRWSQEDYSPAPGLSELPEYVENEDGTWTWTYRMNPDATWSDGEPVTADDAKFTFELLQSDEIFNARHGTLVNAMTSIEAPDDHTLVITTAESSATMTHLNNTMIMPEHVWSEIENPGEYTGEPGQPTSGPFELEEYSPGERVVLTANEDYWDGPVAYDKLVMQNFETTEAAVQALQSGEVDLLDGLNPEQAAALESNPDITVSIQPSRHWDSLGFNTGARSADGEEFGDGHPALKDVTVRQAIHHVINKERLVEVIFGGSGTTGVSIVAPVFSEHYYDPGADTVEVSADLGNQLLDDAGYDERDSDGIRIDPESGESLAFRMLYHSDRPYYADIKDFIVDWIAELDIAVEPIAMDSTPLNEETEAGNYDLAFGGWNYGPDPDEDFAYHSCSRLADDTEPNGLTFSFWCDEDFETLFEKQKMEPDLDARAEQVREMQRIVYEEAPHIILFYDYAVEAYSNDWTGFGMLPAAGGSITRQQGSYGYGGATPVELAEDDGNGDGAASDSDDGGSSTGLIIGAVVVVLLAAGGGYWFLQRRRTAEDRE
jgi:peptide/nickel transport system substrate-binding protein